ncbi:MAG: DUF2249 domain-containing protein [Alphaproteobacteria bacterium]
MHQTPLARGGNVDGGIDLRGMQPPEPMVILLRHVESGPGSGALTVLLPHEPLPLYPELEARNWSWEVLEILPGGVRLRIFPLPEGHGRS